MSAQATLRIGEVAARAGVNVSLVRYYDRIGLVPAAERVGGRRRYDESALRRLAVIDVAQRAGLSLAEIKELLDHGSDPVSERLHEVAERRLPEIDALIDRARRVRTWLESAADCDCQSIDECELFDDAERVAPTGGASSLGALSGHMPRERAQGRQARRSAAR